MRLRTKGVGLGREVLCRWTSRIPILGSFIYALQHCPRHQVVRHRPELPVSPGDGNPFDGLVGDPPQQPGLSTAGRDWLELVTPGGVEGTAGPDRRSFEPEAVVSPQPSASPIIQGLPVQFSR
jgi:hypothetical protein